MTQEELDKKHATKCAYDKPVIWCPICRRHVPKYHQHMGRAEIFAMPTIVVKEEK